MSKNKLLVLFLIFACVITPRIKNLSLFKNFTNSNKK